MELSDRALLELVLRYHPETKDLGEEDRKQWLRDLVVKSKNGVQVIEPPTATAKLLATRM